MKTIQEVMNIKINNMELSVRSKNGLKNAGINTLSEITKNKKEETMLSRNMGKKSLEEISMKIESIGLTYSMTDYDWLIWGLNNKTWILTHEQCL